jgi:hypothetical protein
VSPSSAGSPATDVSRSPGGSPPVSGVVAAGEKATYSPLLDSNE